MALGTYKIPDEFKDEDKYFRFFTKKQLLALIIAVVIGVTLLVFFSKLGLTPVGLVFMLLIVLSIGVCVMIPIPEDRYLIGGGEKIYVIVLRILLKRLPKNRVIYIKNYKKK